MTKRNTQELGAFSPLPLDPGSAPRRFRSAIHADPLRGSDDPTLDFQIDFHPFRHGFSRFRVLERTGEHLITSVFGNGLGGNLPAPYKWVTCASMGGARTARAQEHTHRKASRDRCGYAIRTTQTRRKHRFASKQKGLPDSPRKPLSYLVGHVGIETTTNGLRVLFIRVLTRLHKFEQLLKPH